MTVIRKDNGQRLTVLDVTEFWDGRPAYVVCKEGAPNPQMGRFKIAQDAVEPDFK
jgi:hypothetical protein